MLTTEQGSLDVSSSKMNSYSSTFMTVPFKNGLTWQGVSVQLRYNTCVESRLNSLRIALDDEMTGE